MDSHQRGRESCRRTHTDLKPLQTKADVQRFLESIRKEFLSSVDVDESGLEDELVETGVLKYDSDVESLRCKYPVRKDKARRVWTILYTIDHTIFITEALPVLCTKFFHIIPPEFWKEQSDCTLMTSHVSGETAESVSEVTCVRCAAKHRVREKAMTDLLYECQIITFDDYRIHTGEPSARNWDSILNILENIHPDKTESFSTNFQQLLKSYSLTVPHNLEDLIKRGLPCMCSTPPEINISNDWTETYNNWSYYSHHEHRRGSDVSTEPSQYPESEKDSDSCCSSRTGTLNTSILSSNTSGYFLPEPDEEATSGEHPDGFIDQTQAGPALENKTRKRGSKGALSSQKHALSSIVYETKRFLHSQQNVHLDSHVSEVDMVGADRATSKLRAGRNFALYPDVLYKTFRLRCTRKKKRPALKEFLQRISPQHDFHSIIQNKTLAVTKEVNYAVPQCDYECHIEGLVITEELMDTLTNSETENIAVTKELKESLTESETALSESDTGNFGDTEDLIDSLSESDTENFSTTEESPYSQTKRTESLGASGDFIARDDTENPGFDRGLEDSITASGTEKEDVKEHVECLLPDFRRETTTKAPLTTLDASRKDGVKEAVSSLSQDMVEETTILTELCDLVASCFPLNGDLTDHLQKAQTWAVDEGHTPTLTVASCLKMDAHLQETLTRLEKVKQEQPASSSKQDSEVLMVCESVLSSCLGLVLGLKMCLLCDSTLELMHKLDIPSNRDAEDKFMQMRGSASSRMRSCLEDILHKIKTVAEQQISQPWKFPDSFGEDLIHLQAILSSILPHLS